MKNGEIKYVHGITKDNIHDYLIEPVLETYIGSIVDTDIFELWTVFHEDKNSNSGYTIFFDEESNCFGLGMYSSDGELMLISEYGTFLETLNSI